MTPARTLRDAVRLGGPALFSGRDAAITVHPAPPGTGLRCRIGHAEGPATVAHLSDRPAHPAFAGRRPRCTSIDVDGATVAMTEHAMGALAGLGITDAVLETDPFPGTNAGELPIFDGSALDLTRSIRAVGTTDHGSVEPIVLRRPIEVVAGDAVITCEPFDGIDYTYHLDYGPDAPIPPSTARWTGDADDFADRIAPARTFSAQADAEQAKAAGLFTRFTPADLLVIGPGGPIDNAWRFPDECARHKLLDLIGDLALLGRPLHARVRAHRSGHADTHALSRQILAQA